jgi:hypothetical protein
MEIHEWTIPRAFARREFSYSCFSWAKANEIVFLSICHRKWTTGIEILEEVIWTYMRR